MGSSVLKITDYCNQRIRLGSFDNKSKRVYFLRKTRTILWRINRTQINKQSISLSVSMLIFSVSVSVKDVTLADDSKMPEYRP